MSILVQLLVTLLVVLSTVLVVGIPVTLALPGQWEQSRNLIYTGAGIWSSLVIITGVVNSFVA